MTITLPCEGCGRRLKVDGARPGATIACPACGHRSTIPTPERPTPRAGAEPDAPRPAPAPTRPPAPVRGVAATAAIVAAAVVAVGVAVGLGVWVVSEHAAHLGAVPENVNDTVAQLSAEQDRAARQAGALRFANPEQEKVFLEMLRQQEAFSKLLAAVKDRETAERLAPRVKVDYMNLLLISREAMAKVPRPGQAFDELVARHRARIEAFQQAAKEQEARIKGQDFARPVDRAMREINRAFFKGGAEAPAGQGPAAGGRVEGVAPGARAL